METNNTFSEEELVEWWLFLNANPIGVDLGRSEDVSPEFLSQLPENIKNMLWDEKTTSWIYVIGKDFKLSDEQISDLARIIFSISTGKLNPRELTSLIKNIGISETDAPQIAAAITKNLISPNYFQIAQIRGRRTTDEPTSDNPQENTAQEKINEAEIVEETQPTEEQQNKLSNSKPSANVVDLRNKNVGSLPPPPSKLPPAPPIAPRPPAGNSIPPGKRI